MRIISKRYLTEAEVKQWIGLTQDQLDRLRRENNFPNIKVNKLVRMYPLKEVEEWLQGKVEYSEVTE